MQKTKSFLNTDQVLIIQGTNTKLGWTFLPNRMPDVPEITYTIDKPKSKGNIKNNSFHVLSTEGRLFVLTAGTVYPYNCTIDSTYWFGE